MKAIEEVLHGWADYEKIREFLKKEKGIIQISGCVDAGKPSFAPSIKSS